MGRLLTGGECCESLRMGAAESHGNLARKGRGREAEIRIYDIKSLQSTKRFSVPLCWIWVVGSLYCAPLVISGTS